MTRSARASSCRRQAERPIYGFASCTTPRWSTGRKWPRPSARTCEFTDLYLRKAGIQVDLVGAKDWKDFHEQRRKATHDLYLYQWTVSTPDPERFLFRLYHSKSPDNFGSYATAQVDNLLAQARQPMDEAKRLGVYREVTRLILADIPAVFLFHQTTFAAHHARVVGLTLNLYGLPQDKLSSVEIR